MKIDKLNSNIAFIRNSFDLIIEAKGNQKQRVLESLEQYECVKEALRFLLDPYVTTGITSKGFYEFIEKPKTIVPDITFNSLGEVFEYIKVNKTGTNQVYANTFGFLASLDRYNAHFIQGLITKELRLGCGAATVNKVYGKGFIPEFKVMLANKYFENPNAIDGKRFYITEKLDGVRALLVKRGDEITIFTRQGHRISGLSEIEAEALTCPFSFVLDGELLVRNSNSMASKDAYKATTKIVRKDGPKSGIVFNVFDWISISEYDEQKGTTPYYKRRSTLGMWGDMWNPQNIVVVPILYEGDDLSKIFEMLGLMRKANKEGVMVNLADAPYQFKRTSDLLKVKVMQDCDLMIIAVNEGEGRFAGTMGSVTVDYKGHPLGVGSGFTDNEREMFWRERDSLIGRVITVRYFEETVDKNNTPSLRFPVFVELREDGKEVSI